MMQIGLPHVNVLTKADLLKKNSDKLNFSLDYYTDVLNLDYLLDLLDDGPFIKKYKKLNAALVELVQDYSLVCFISLDANGYIYGSGEERTIQALLSCAVGSRRESEQYDADFLMLLWNEDIIMIQFFT
ncbi:ATP bind 1 domain containing protein [Asbolus verrucosus]|uniref:GPN-loop GTPase 2 n=1 Tax=Asbolus verrucosus TaxID=1661398 RepID=A0A482VDQ8_ASBVE|nr:ATP bind 1 domain containing protein [Asbolus verrucosus]